MTHKNTYVGLISHPLLPTIDGTFDFITRAPSDPKTVVVPLLNHHEMDGEQLGWVELVYIPIHRTKEGRDLCLVVGNIKTDFELPDGTALSASYPLKYKKDQANFADEIIEVSIVDKPHLQMCQVYHGDALVDLIKYLKDDQNLKALFLSFLRKIGELDAIPSHQLH